MADDPDQEAPTTAQRPEGIKTRATPINPVGDTLVMPKVIGRFQIVNILGEGGFGKVYKARDPQLGRDVAIKVPRYLDSERGLHRFLREAKAAGTLRHPNICPVFEISEDDANPYIVMAYIPGHSLAQFLKARKEPLPTRQVVSVVRKLALALEVAHTKGIVHRDLKPSNIMVDKDTKELVIMDFGLARNTRKDQSVLTQAGTLLGTPAYMSPEQARGDPSAIGPWSDVYSLGVILYEMLTLTRPFEGSLADVIGQVMLREAEPASKHRPGIDPALDVICKKVLAKEPAQRYRSMKEFADVLNQYLIATVEERIFAVPATDSGTVGRISETPQGLADSTEFSLRAIPEKIGGRRHLYLLAAVAGCMLAAVVLGAVLVPGFLAQRDNPSTEHQGNAEASTPSPANATGKEPTPAKVSDTWVQLFNGKDVSGWKINKALPQGDWYVKNSILTNPGKNTSFLYTERGDFKDFHLRLKARINAEGNAGVFFRAPFGLRPPAEEYTDPVYGVQINSRSRDPNLTGSLWVGNIVVATSVRKALVPPGEWFTLEVLARGNRLVTKVNDQTTADYVDDRQRATIGHIALRHLTSDSVVEFSSIEIKDLPLSQPANPNSAVVVHKEQYRFTPPALLRWFDVHALTPNGAYLLTAGDQAGGKVADVPISVWSLQTGKEEFKLTGNPKRITGLAVSEDGKWAASASSAGGFPKYVRVWNLQTRAMAHEFTFDGGGDKVVAFNRRGQVLACAMNNELVKSWNLQDGKEGTEFKAKDHPKKNVPAIRSVIFSPDGSRLVSGMANGNIRVWDAATGDTLSQWPGHPNFPVTCLSLSKDNRLLVSAGNDLTIRVWDAGTSLELANIAHPCVPRCVALSSDKKHFAVGFEDAVIRVYAINTRAEVARLVAHTEAPLFVAFTPDGRGVISSARDGTVRVWQVALK